MAYNTQTCPICGATISAGGAASTSHFRSHVRKGEATEESGTNDKGKHCLVFVPVPGKTPTAPSSKPAPEKEPVPSPLPVLSPSLSEVRAATTGIPGLPATSSVLGEDSFFFIRSLHMDPKAKETYTLENCAETSFWDAMEEAKSLGYFGLSIRRSDGGMDGVFSVSSHMEVPTFKVEVRSPKDESIREVIFLGSRIQDAESVFRTFEKTAVPVIYALPSPVPHS